MCRSLQVDLQTRAVAYYLQRHLPSPTTHDLNISSNLSGCLFTWKLSGKPCPSVELALSSMALAVFSRTHQHPPAALEASSVYNRSLKATKDMVAACETSNEQLIDSCLLAAFLMSRYETSTRRVNDLKPNVSCLLHQNWSHQDGAMAILKFWKQDPHSKTSPIIQQSRRSLIKLNLLRNFPVPAWMADGSPFGEQGFALDYDRIEVQAINLHHTVSTLSSLASDVQTVSELSEEARELDEALQDWESNIPSRYESHNLSASDFGCRKGFYSSTVFSYSAPEHATIWAHYFALRMLINSMQLRVLNLSPTNTLIRCFQEQEERECVIKLHAMGHSLAFTIPYCLEKFTLDRSTSSNHQAPVKLNLNEKVKPHLAALVVWPLTIASSLEAVDPELQRWFRAELSALGRIAGEGVLECSETTQWAML